MWCLEQQKLSYILTFLCCFWYICKYKIVPSNGKKSLDICFTFCDYIRNNIELRFLNVFLQMIVITYPMQCWRENISSQGWFEFCGSYWSTARSIGQMLWPQFLDRPIEMWSMLVESKYFLCGTRNWSMRASLYTRDIFVVKLGSAARKLPEIILTVCGMTRAISTKI